MKGIESIKEELSKDKIEIASMAITLCQDSDSLVETILQELRIETDDAGGGPFIVMSTERWSMDSADSLRLLADLTEAMVRISGGGD